MKTETDVLIGSLISELDTEEGPSFSPTKAATSREEKILTVDDETLKKLYSLLSFYRREAEMSKVSFSYSQNDEDLRASAERLDEKATVLGDLFWFFLKERYPQLWHEVGIGIRTDWIIVRRSANLNDIGKILGDLLGGSR